MKTQLLNPMSYALNGAWAVNACAPFAFAGTRPVFGLCGNAPRLTADSVIK